VTPDVRGLAEKIHRSLLRAAPRRAGIDRLLAWIAW
jgi:hypothetical protein